MVKERSIGTFAGHEKVTGAGRKPFARKPAPVVLRGVLRSTNNVVVAGFTLNAWRTRTPSVDEVRPAFCPECGQASQAVGRGLTLHGHGFRERRVLGPLAPGQAAEVLLIKLRRYVCLVCSALITVVPRGLARGRRFSSAAIGLALAMWSALRLSAVEVRQKVSPYPARGFDAVLGWASLRRWARAVRRGALFPWVRSCPANWSLREVAEHTTSTLASSGPLSASAEPLLIRVHAGAAHAA